jgi:signal transduction histidine kinase
MRATARQYDIACGLYVALRFGSEVIGFHTACRRGPAERFAAVQLRVAQGIGQLASLALQNARLVEKLERASRLKSEFVSTISHELRTPLNVIIGYDTLLLEGAFGDLSPEQSDPIQRIDANAKELLELITATLDMSRLEAGQLKADVQEFAVPDLIAEIQRDTRELREKPELRFAFVVPAGLAPLSSDRAKLKVVLKNLIRNAVKFTDRGSVVVTVRGGAGGVEFAVADTGIGIPRQAQASIFEPFRQADGSPTRRHGGVGLGLHIVRRLLDLLGGQITVESEVGRGSTFRVWVPWREPAAASSGGAGDSAAPPAIPEHPPRANRGDRGRQLTYAG